MMEPMVWILPEIGFKALMFIALGGLAVMTIFLLVQFIKELKNGKLW